MTADDTKCHQTPIVMLDELDQLNDIEDRQTVKAGLTRTER